ncbi:hypothetical protein J6590_044834 [Homalodisca vitripennis]|nr:hypothetical protein J6590_044833 [Homalodisca vitripennis]KAG8282094.1 hypothetical protein J6590_044834 [Homalodisca vitripennis]
MDRWALRVYVHSELTRQPRRNPSSVYFPQGPWCGLYDATYQRFLELDINNTRFTCSTYFVSSLKPDGREPGHVRFFPCSGRCHPYTTMIHLKPTRQTHSVELPFDISLSEANTELSLRVESQRYHLLLSYTECKLRSAKPETIPNRLTY